MTNSLQTKIKDLRQSIASTLVSQGLYPGAEQTPIATLGALLSFIDQHKELAGAEEERCAAFFLLAEICNEVPRSLLKAQRQTVLLFTLTVVEMDTDASTTIRYCIRCIEKTLNTIDAAAWQEPIVKSSIDALVALSIDDRSSVRKAAHHTVQHILANPPPPNSVHPVARHAGTCIGRLLTELLGSNDFTSALHLLSMLHRLTLFLPDTVIEPLVDLLYGLPARNLPTVTRSVFGVFTAVASRPAAFTAWDATKRAALLDAVLAIKPNADDRVLAAAWLAATAAALEALNVENPALGAARLHSVIADHLFPALQSQHATVLAAAEKVIVRLVDKCVPDLMIEHALAALAAAGGLPASQREQRADLERIVITCELGLSVRYQAAWPHVLRILGALVRRLGATAASLMRGTLELVGEFRDEPEFPHKHELDGLLATAVTSMGARAFLSVLPLNIERAGEPGVPVRTYLLPLMEHSVQRTELGYFVEAFVPLAKHLAARVAAYSAQDNREVEAKVHEALYLQVWSLLPGFCTYPTDLKASFGGIGPIMGDALRDEPALRAVVCHALHNLIAKNRAIAALPSDDDVPEDLVRACGLTRESAATNVRGIAVSAKFFLPLLFNLYKEMSATARVHVADLIAEFVAIADIPVLSMLYSQVMGSLQAPSADGTGAAALAPELQDSLLDLAMLLLPRLPEAAVQPLFQLVLQGLGSAHQKKCYRMLTKMLGMPNGLAVLNSQLTVLEEQVIVGGSLQTELGAKKYRLQFLCAAVEALVTPSVRLVTLLLPEAMESFKEANGTARELGGELVIKLGNKMLEDDGGDDAMTDEHGIDRFIKMIAAGLVATSPYFVSATVMVLARVCYEFRDLVSDELFASMLPAILVLLQMKNREVSKTVFKFMKVTSVAFPKETVQPHLASLMDAALHLGDAYGSEFKVPVRHFTQRMCREFSVDAIEAVVPEAHRKLISNIRKRTERAKRRRAAGEESGAKATDAAKAARDGDDETIGMTKRGSSRAGDYSGAFDRIVYGDSSDSEVEDDGPVVANTSGAPKKSKRASALSNSDDLYIQEDEADVMDFLDQRVVSHVLASKPRSTKQRQEERKRKLDTEFEVNADGRLVIPAESGASSAGGKSARMAAVAAAAQAAGGSVGAFDYYMESIESADGFKRAGRKIKFDHAASLASRTQAADWGSDDEGAAATAEPRSLGVRRGEAEEDDTEATASAAPAAKKQTARKVGPRVSVRGLGAEYRSKKAHGDVKRAGMPDPFAYVPLSAKIVGNRHKSVKLSGSMLAGVAKGDKGKRKISGYKTKQHKK
ncbi:NUC173 domain-containing protein [Blastocladiella britannica]|nr:NUC173 domain-containing protein [Blastocladiella britannica]